MSEIFGSAHSDPKTKVTGVNKVTDKDKPEGIPANILCLKFLDGGKK
jgi:hypothetical protein